MSRTSNYRSRHGLWRLVAVFPLNFEDTYHFNFTIFTANIGGRFATVR